MKEEEVEQWGDQQQKQHQINLAVHHFLEMLGSMIQFVSITPQCSIYHS